MGSEDKIDSECQEKATNGRSYEGRENKSKTGKTCKSWVTVDTSKNWGLSENWCRNPDNEESDDGGVWCYVEKLLIGGRWEYCAVSWCNEGKTT